MRQVARKQVSRRRFRLVPIALAAVVASSALVEAARAQVSRGSSGAGRDAASYKVNLVHSQLGNATEELLKLENRVPPMAEEVQNWIDRLTALTNNRPEKVEETKEKPGAVKRVLFRPPLAEMSQKEDTVTFVIQNNHVSISHAEALNEVYKTGMEQILTEARAEAQRGQAKTWKGEWPVSKGDFNLAYDCELSGATLSYRTYTTRKPNQWGEAASAINDPGSEFRRALTAADPAKVIVRFFVYPDSFELFREARNYAWKGRFEVGWDPMISGSNLGFGGVSGFTRQ